MRSIQQQSLWSFSKICLRKTKLDICQIGNGFMNVAFLLTLNRYLVCFGCKINTKENII